MRNTKKAWNGNTVALISAILSAIGKKITLLPGIYSSSSAKHTHLRLGVKFSIDANPYPLRVKSCQINDENWTRKTTASLTKFNNQRLRFFF